mmetsp:Transcript_18558/g.55015  ORF Transcript_18558/g.55015 Transcript_18558/m.55015 type:complete len:228 (+) Transcript_18558:2142-2825(+)
MQATCPRESVETDSSVTGIFRRRAPTAAARPSPSRCSRGGRRTPRSRAPSHCGPLGTALAARACTAASSAPFPLRIATLWHYIGSRRPDSSPAVPQGRWNRRGPVTGSRDRCDYPCLPRSTVPYTWAQRSASPLDAALARCRVACRHPRPWCRADRWLRCQWLPPSQTCTWRWGCRVCLRARRVMEPYGQIDGRARADTSKIPLYRSSSSSREGGSPCRRSLREQPQ